MNIQFDTDEMDLLLLQMKDTLSQADECYLGLRRLYSELMDDAAMQMVPETHLALGHLERAASRMYILRDRMETLVELVRQYPEAIEEREKKFQKQTEDLTLSIESWNEGVSVMGMTGYDCVLSGDAQTESSQRGSAVNQTGSTMTLTNLGTLKSAVEDGYGKTE